MVYQILQYYINQQLIEDLEDLLLNVGNQEFGAIEDKNCFLFSLDKKKIYYPKNNYIYISNRPEQGPCF